MKNGYFNDQSFVNYLKYLKYWGTPEYIKYIKFPICLYFLDLLTSDDNYYKKFQNDNTIRPILDETINFTMRSLYNYRGWAEKSFAEAKKQELEELEQQQQQPPQLPPPTQQQQL